MLNKEQEIKIESTKNNNSKYYTTNQTAKYFNVSHLTIRSWIKKDILKQLEPMDHLQDTGDMISHLSQEKFLFQINPTLEKKPKKINKKHYLINKNPQNQELSIAESFLLTKKKILNDKLIKYLHFIQNMKFLKILEVASTLSDRTFSNLSKKQLKEISKKLWLIYLIYHIYDILNIPISISYMIC